MIEELKDKYHLLVPDLRGFGDSTYNRESQALKN